MYIELGFTSLGLIGDLNDEKIKPNDKINVINITSNLLFSTLLSDFQSNWPFNYHWIDDFVLGATIRTLTFNIFPASLKLKRVLQ